LWDPSRAKYAAVRRNLPAKQFASDEMFFGAAQQQQQQKKKKNWIELTKQ
jgi:hypothetical protein